MNSLNKISNILKKLLGRKVVVSQNGYFIVIIATAFFVCLLTSSAFIFTNKHLMETHKQVLKHTRNVLRIEKEMLRRIKTDYEIIRLCRLKLNNSTSKGDLSKSCFTIDTNNFYKNLILED